MPAPAKPTVPDTPTRAEPSTFSERSERMVDFFFALLGYIAECQRLYGRTGAISVDCRDGKQSCRP